MQRLVGKTEESRFEIDTYSVSHTPVQRWHADADAFTRAEDFKGGDVVHLPPSAFANFIPLEDISLQMGPVEFLLKSHMQCSSTDKSTSREEPFEKNCKYAEKAGTWHATAQSGDTILFDLRTHHRGGASQNRTKRDRPQVYLNFFRESYAVNVAKHQTRRFDSLSLSAKKRFARVDQLAYIQELEAQLAEAHPDGARHVQRMKSDPSNLQRDRKLEDRDRSRRVSVSGSVQSNP